MPIACGKWLIILLTVRKSAVIACALTLFLATRALSSSLVQQSQPLHTTQILLILPFENVSSAPGIDWVGESFPEVIGNRTNSTPLFIINRDDRLYAFDRLGIPASAKPSR